jgi:catecholate siderophore receptor
MWINQTNLRADFDTFGLAHSLATGVEVSRENYDRITYNHGLGDALYPADGYALANPPGYWSGPINEARSADTSTQLDNQAVYVFDTIALAPQWDLNLGLRYDWVDGEYKNVALPAGTLTKLDTSDEMLSGRAGLVYKPAENGRIYVAYGTSFNPSAEFLASNAGGVNVNNADLDPEENETWELGTKWELFDRRLELDAALFRVEKTNAREEVLDDVYALAGEQRVQGVELGLTGHITERWDVFANYTFLDSETRKSVSNPEREGQALANTPPRSFNLWTSYELPTGWTLGYGARYVSERNVASSGTAKLDAYWLHNAMVGYRVSRNLDLQLNVNNLFDEDYVERVRQTAGTVSRSAAIEYGDARSAILSANYSF